MRLIRLVPFVALLMAAPASAQEWTDFTSKIDRFTVNLPGEPKAQDLKITVRCHQLRDSSDGCLLGFITAADGVETIFD